MTRPAQDRQTGDTAVLCLVTRPERLPPHTHTRTRHCENSRVSEAPAPQVSWRSSSRRRTRVLPCFLSSLLRSPGWMCVPRLNQRTLCSGTFQGGIPHEGKLGGPEGWVSGVCLSCWRRCSGDTGRRTKAGRTEPRWPRCQRPRAGAGAGEPGSPGKLVAGWRPAGQTAVPWAGQLCLVQTWGEEPRLPAPETARGCPQSPQERGPRARVAEGTGFPRRPGWRARPSEAPLPRLTQSPPQAASATVPVTLTQILLSVLK